MTEGRHGRRWRRWTFRELHDELIHDAGPTPVVIVGVDGRSGSGKTALARGLALSAPHTAVVHTDDLSWHHSFFGWADLLITGILQPLRTEGAPLRYRPPAWGARGRIGDIHIPADTAVLVVEGVGACRPEVRPFLDTTVWVDVPPHVGLERVTARGVDTPTFLADWHAAEVDHLAASQPWRHADIVIDGDAEHQTGTVVLSAGPGSHRT